MYAIRKLFNVLRKIDKKMPFALFVSSAKAKEYTKTRTQNVQNLCNAPFNSMRFERYGKVYVCCHNNAFVAGIYPKMSIRQIWDGEALSCFRKNIKENKLHNGCGSCYHAILNAQYNSVSASMFDHFPVQKDFPSMLDFKTDNTCNLNCVMCFSYSSCLKASENFEKNHAFEPYDEGFLNEISPFLEHLTETRFSGGEPFLSDFYFKLWEKILEINPQSIITVQTNGHVNNQRIQNLLERGRFSINVSLDSLDDEVYKNIRVNGSLNTVLSNIGYFSEYCRKKETRFRITICPMRQNALELPSMIEYCNKINAYAWFSIVWYPFKYAIWSLSEQDLENIYHTLKKYELPENSPIEKYNKSIFNDLLENIKQWINFSRKRQNSKPIKPEKIQDYISKATPNYFNSLSHLSNAERESRGDSFNKKMSGVYELFAYNDVPENSFDLLLEYYNPDMLIEILDTERQENIFENIKALKL